MSACVLIHKEEVSYLELFPSLSSFYWLITANSDNKNLNKSAIGLGLSCEYEK